MFRSLEGEEDPIAEGPTTAAPPEADLVLDAEKHVHVTHDSGSDGISVLETHAPHGDSPPLHVHRGEDEAFHVLEGELRLRVGDEELRLGAGRTALAPKGVPHTYRVESPGGARWLVITTRGDFERFVFAVARPAEADGMPEPEGPPTPEQAQALASIAREHDIEFVGPPLGV